MKKPILLIALLHCAFVVCAGLRAAPASAVPGIVFHDNFTSLAQWTPVGGATPRLTNPGEAMIGNSVQQASLSRPVSSFSLRARIRHREWARAAIVWITDESGGQGYGVMWDSARETNYTGEGHVSILRLNQSAPPSYQTLGQRLNEVISSGHAVMSEEPAEIQLDRSADGRLALSVDGRLLLTVNDAAWNKFDTLFIRGNGKTIFASISVTEGAAR